MPLDSPTLPQAASIDASTVKSPVTSNRRCTAAGTHTDRIASLSSLQVVSQSNMRLQLSQRSV
jgi:hypothetical protein